MIVKYEIRHQGRSKKFDTLEDAVKLGKGLEKLGYRVVLNIITYSVYETIIRQIYKTKEVE